MGSAGDTPRKPRHPLPKVPKYEEPNSLPLGGGAGQGYGRFGHGSGHHDPDKPGRAGAFLLRILGMRPKK
jgi:hypothetical protein